MSKVNYLLIDASVLPDVYNKVVYAKRLLLSGEAANVSCAVKMAGISRSAYYKYKDKVFEYSSQGDDTLTVSARLSDNAGVLSSLMNILYECGVNILSVNQTVPVNGAANVSITARASNVNTAQNEMLSKIKSIGGVQSVEVKSGKRKEN